MKINTTQNNINTQKSFTAKLKIIDTHNLVPKTLVEHYKAEYAKLGTKADKVTIAIKPVTGEMDEQLEFGVGILKNNDLDVFVDNINLWIYDAKQSAEHQLRNVLTIVQNKFKN